MCEYPGITSSWVDVIAFGLTFQEASFQGQIYGEGTNNLAWYFLGCWCPTGLEVSPSLGQVWKVPHVPFWSCGQRACSSGHIEGNLETWRPEPSGFSTQWQWLCGCFPENFDLLWKLIIGEWLLLWILTGLIYPSSHLFVETALLLSCPWGSALPTWIHLIVLGLALD